LARRCRFKRLKTCFAGYLVGFWGQRSGDNRHIAATPTISPPAFEAPAPPADGKLDGGLACLHPSLSTMTAYPPANSVAILVSACLLGQPVRYDGHAKRCDHPLLQRWVDEGCLLVPVCPELAGGLAVPRAPAEITRGAGGNQVLIGAAQVMDAQAQDVSAAFVAGAQQALALAQRHQVRLAILKQGSPSCGSAYIYDGSFSGQKVANMGVTTALLQQAGIQVFGEDQLAAADWALQRLRRGASSSQNG